MLNSDNNAMVNIMRALHRDVGFFVIGLVLIYAVSGIILIYRDTDFLKTEKNVEKQLSPNIGDRELGQAMHVRKLEITKTEGDIIYFKNGTYNKVTGMAVYTEKSLPVVIQKLTGLHVTASSSLIHIFGAVFAFSLVFLAVSSFWMFKPSTKMFRRGAAISVAGMIFAAMLVLLV